MAREKQIPPSRPWGKGGDETPPFEKGGWGGIPAATLTLNDFEPRLKSYARDLRKRQTDAEQHLWQHLRRDQLGVRFLRQRPLGSYIVDFYAPKAGLVIELDGGQHFEPEYQVRDEERDAWLSAQGLKVLRFDDRQVLAETRAVLEAIFRVVHEATGGQIPPNPPFAKGGTTPLTLIEGFPPLQQKGTPESVPPRRPPLQKGGGGGLGDVSTCADVPE